MRVVLQASTALILAACGPTPESDQPASAQQIKPGTIVTFPMGPIACLTEGALRTAFISTLAGNEPKFGPRFEGGAECITINPATRYKVVATDELGKEMPEAAIFRVVDEAGAAGARETFVLALGRSFVREQQLTER